MNRGTIDSPWGAMAIETAGGVVAMLGWAGRQVAGQSIRPPAPLADYFGGRLDALDELQVGGAGTRFQQRVWRALRQIPPGEVASYAAIARRIGSSPRAVGGACRANRVVLVIPCHRVVASSGIGGYEGRWGEGGSIALKQALLRHEGWGDGEAG